MNINEYDILYFDGKTTITDICKISKLSEYLENIFKKYDNNVCVYIQPKLEATEKIKKQKFYKSKYVSARKKYKDGKIDKEEFEEDVKQLKELKEQCTTKLEYEEKYKNYQNKKNTNIYNPL